MRWFGKEDPIQLERIRQVPGLMGVVSALYGQSIGEVWPLDRIMALKESVEDLGLSLEVIESIPVHEDIKLGLPTRDKYIENYCKSIENLGRAGIEVLCYNFMPVFDWTRTTLDHRFADGSLALGFDYAKLAEFQKDTSKALALPGWAEVYSQEDLNQLMASFRKIGVDEMWDNLAYFLKAVIPVAEKAGVRMAIHPDDPPWPILGLPRIITNEAALLRLVKIIDSPSNGVTLCSGSLGASPANNLPQMTRNLADKIFFVHMRNVHVTGPKTFHEAPHPSSMGSLDMYGIMKSLVEIGYSGPIRPDHGRMIWGEEGRPGYGLFDRALGAMYLQGLNEAAQKELTYGR